jgi:signal transduction histidine kinase
VIQPDFNFEQRVLSAAETALIEVLGDERRRSQEKDLLLKVLLHELANIGMGVVQGLELAQLGMNGSGDPCLVEGMAHARKASNRFSRIAQDLRVLLDENDFAPLQISDLERFVQDEAWGIGRVRFSLKCAHPVRRFAPVLVRHILSNLVGNALRYTTDPESVFVGLRGGGETVRISVGSRGAPLSDRLKGVLFVPGHQGDDPKHGSGLGLYVSHRCALRHDGWIALRRIRGVNVFTAFLHAPVAA